MSGTLIIELDKLFPDQQEIYDHMFDDGARFVILRCGRRYGKGVLGKHTLVEHMLAGESTAWFAPTYKMLEQVWREMLDALRPVISKKSEKEHRLELVTGGSLDMWSMESIDSARGRKYHIVVLDECAMDNNLVDHWFGVIRPTLIDYEGRALFPSTPNGRNGFYTMHSWAMNEEEPEWKEYHRTTYDNPYVNKEEGHRLQKTMSEKWYRQEIMAEFLENEGSVFRNLESALRAPKTVPEEHASHLVVAGIDWARDNDYTVISNGCATCRRELYIDRFNKIDYTFQTGRVVVNFATWNVRSASFELNSIGRPQFDSIVPQLPGVSCEGFDTTPTSKGPLIDTLALELEKGTILFQNDEYARTELEAYEAHLTESGHIKYSAPQGMNDDTVIARALMTRSMNNFRHIGRKIHQRRNPLEALIGNRP